VHHERWGINEYDLGDIKNTGNASVGNKGTMSTGLAVSRKRLDAPAIVAKPLRVAFSWTLAGNAIYYACQWGMLSVLAKLGSAAVVGRFALGMAITAPVFMFTNLQLRGVQATDSRSEFEFADYFTLRCLATSLGFAAVVAVALLSRYDRSTRCVIVLLGGAKSVESLSDVVAGLMQRVERLDQLATSLMIKGIASIIAFTAVFWTLRSLAAAVSAIGLTWLLVFLLYDFRLARKAIGSTAKMLKLNSEILGRLVVLSLPLGIVMALMSLNTNIPRYVLEHYLGESKLGIFASLAYLGTAASLIINALGQSAAARLSRMFADRQFEAFTLLLQKFALLGALIGVIGVPAAAVFGRVVLSILYRPEYANYLSVFLIVIATTSVLAVASFLGYGVTAARSFKMPMLVNGATTLTTAMLSLLLVPRFGLMGAAIALLLAALVQVVGFMLLMNIELRTARGRRSKDAAEPISDFALESSF
jgi:O-antigen/teichoic acid export membrane protein